MKKSLVLPVFTAVLLITSPAWAINKCTGPDGKVAFQDAPCQGKGELLDVKPASGKGNAPAVAPAVPGTATAAKPLTEAQRIDAQVTASQRERRRRDLEQLFIPQALDALERVPVQGRPARKSADASAAVWPASAAAQAYAVALLGLAAVRPSAKAFYLATSALQLVLLSADEEGMAGGVAARWSESYKALEISVAALADGQLSEI